MRKRRDPKNSEGRRPGDGVARRWTIWVDRIGGALGCLAGLLAVAALLLVRPCANDFVLAPVELDAHVIEDRIEQGDRLFRIGAYADAQQKYASAAHLVVELRGYDQRRAVAGSSSTGVLDVYDAALSVRLKLTRIALASRKAGAQSSSRGSDTLEGTP